VSSKEAAKGFVRLLAGLAALTTAGCASMLSQEPTSEFSSAVYRPYQKLLDLYPPANKIAVAVYRYDDKTGQFKPSQPSQTLSRAVTQGAATILVQALQNAGRGSWFTIVERENLNNLLTERKIITQMRKQYLSPQGQKLAPLTPMLYAGIIFEGGIVGYDSNTVTGGAGARYLGIGGNVEYRQDTVTVYLRAISTKNGAILKSVMTTKNIFSFLVRADVFKFIDFAKLLEVETGYTNNEPGMFALKKAIEKAVYLMVMEGAGDKMWSFRDPEQGRKALLAYRAEEYDDPNPPSRQATKQATAKTESKPYTPNSAPTKRAAAAASQAKPAPSAANSKAQAAPTSGARRPATTKKMNRAARTKVAAKRPYTVHLATATSPQLIKTTWTRFRRAQPDLFLGVRAAIDRRNLGQGKGTAYRLVAGPFASARAAADFCGRANKRDFYCRVVRPPLATVSSAPAKPATVRPFSTSKSTQSAPMKTAGSSIARAITAPTFTAGGKATVIPIAGYAGAPFKSGAAQGKSYAGTVPSSLAADKLRNWPRDTPQGVSANLTNQPLRPKHGNFAPYVVQLASMRSESGARRAWSRLSKANPGLFDDVKPAIIAKKTLGRDQGTWYRVMVGPFGSARTAGDFCSRMKKRKLACGVRRR